jgi:hypothetical protein
VGAQQSVLSVRAEMATHRFSSQLKVAPLHTQSGPATHAQ